MGYTTSPNMSLPVPGVGSEAGPQYATDINNCLSIIDSHNHASGQGVQITPAGLNINATLSFQSNALTNLNYGAFSGAVSGTPSTLALYSDGTDLYFKDISGSQIQITKSHGVNTATGNIQGLPSTPSGGAGISWSNAQSTFQMLADSGSVGSGANIDCGTLVIRYPGSYPTPTGNSIQLRAPSSLSSSYNITLPGTNTLGATGVLTYSSANVLGFVSYDTVGTSMTSTGANAIGSTMTSTGANAVANTRTRSFASSTQGNIAVAPTNCGTFTTTSTSAVQVTFQSLTITSNGNSPIMLWFGPDTQQFSATTGTISIATTTSVVSSATIKIRNTTVGLTRDVLSIIIQNPNTSTTPLKSPSILFGMDPQLINGSVSYDVEVFVGGANQQLIISNYILMAWQL